MVGAMPVNIIPKFYNGVMDTHNGVEEKELSVFVGSRVKCGEDFGSVKYVGEVQGYKGTWYGVEWDDPARGKHDGSIDGVRYFKTSKPNAGSFVRPNKIGNFTTCADAIKHYYGDREDETVEVHQKMVISEWKREMKAPFIEMVGFEKIHQKQKLDRLLDVCVHDQNINKAGNVAALCPNVRSLDVSRNLFSNWREVIQLSAQLPHLRELDVHKNRMILDDISEETLTQLSINLMNLEKINISKCDYDWVDILKLSHLFPRITEITAAVNRITKIVAPRLTLQHLMCLRLDGNAISSWDEIIKLGSLKKLKVLSLNDCLFQKIRFNCADEKVDLFVGLEVLFLNRNRIDDWRSISELDKLQSLKKLYFLKNPIQETEDYDTGTELIIAKIGSLQMINGTEITAEERRGAEYSYMNRYGAEWKAAQATGDHMPFHMEHCRFQYLVNKYGIPDDSLLEKKTKNTTLTSQLIEINLQDENGKTFKKKFPSTMSVQKLVTLAQRLLSKAGNTGVPKLYCIDAKMNMEICLDNYMKDLTYFSVKNGDVVQARWR